MYMKSNAESIHAITYNIVTVIIFVHIQSTQYGWYDNMKFASHQTRLSLPV